MGVCDYSLCADKQLLRQMNHVVCSDHFYPGCHLLLLILLS